MIACDARCSRGYEVTVLGERQYSVVYRTPETRELQNALSELRGLWLGQAHALCPRGFHVSEYREDSELWSHGPSTAVVEGNVTCDAG